MFCFLKVWFIFLSNFLQCNLNIPSLALSFMWCHVILLFFLGEAVLYNIFYEIFTACTSIIAQDESGRMKFLSKTELCFSYIFNWRLLSCRSNSYIEPYFYIPRVCRSDIESCPQEESKLHPPVYHVVCLWSISSVWQAQITSIDSFLCVLC